MTLFNFETLRYGDNKWRDSADPIEILYDWVKKEGIAEPKWTDNNTIVSIGEETYLLENFGTYVGVVRFFSTKLIVHTSHKNCIITINLNQQTKGKKSPL